MQRHTSTLSVIGRSLVVTFASGSALLASAVSASAGTGNDPTTGAASSPGVPSATTIAGVSIGTVAWASIGLLILVVGFVAASKSGYRTAAVVAGAGSPAGSADLGDSPAGARQSLGDMGNDLGNAALAAS